MAMDEEGRNKEEREREIGSHSAVRVYTLRFHSINQKTALSQANVRADDLKQNLVI
jgi:hypothetical protein